VSDSEQVQIGRIVKPHGIRGEVSVALTSDIPGRFSPGEVVTAHDGRHLTVESSRPHQGRLLVKFDGVADRTAAELLRGLRLHGEPADVSDSDVYYAHELVGMLVIHEDGRFLGYVQDLVELPDAAGYDLLEVAREDGSTWLLPATDDYAEIHEDADGEEVLVLVDPPPGLVDDTEAEVVRAPTGKDS
jgi:16S rRNA processing protein RimM